MDLIFYRGLNCHLACIVNIAHLLGVNYLDAFATLWSETDFTDEVKYNLYVSKRVFANLKSLGVIMETLDCGEVKAEESLSLISDGEWFFMGMDTFHIPWHPVFGNFHSPHYFFARKETAHSFLCFDPVYGEKDAILCSGDLSPSVFEVCRVHIVDAKPGSASPSREAGEVLRRHPETREKLLADIRGCEGDGKDNIAPLIKEITAMINNRYLFRQFLHNAAPFRERYGVFFCDSFFLEWEAVRNGLYKALILKDNKDAVKEVYGLLGDLMNKELGIAGEIAAMVLPAEG